MAETKLEQFLGHLKAKSSEFYAAQQFWCFSTKSGSLWLDSSHTRVWHNLVTTPVPWSPEQSVWAQLPELQCSSGSELLCASWSSDFHAHPWCQGHSPGPWRTPRWPCGRGWCSQPSSARSAPAHTAGTLLSPPSADSHLCLPCQQFQRDRPLLSSHLGGGSTRQNWEAFATWCQISNITNQLSCVDTVCSVNKIFNTSF